MANFLNIEDLLLAKKQIKSKIIHTPIIKSSYFSNLFKFKLLLKLELFQKTGSFKIRGVLNKLSKLSQNEKSNGVISLSAGNHAQALAWAATENGIDSTIIMPHNASKAKILSTKYYGGNVVLTKDNLLEECLKIKERKNLTLIHPFDDHHVIAGQGTIGLEIAEYSENLDYVLVGIGGGGLISGIALALKNKYPKIKIIGVEPINSNVILI